MDTPTATLILTGTIGCVTAYIAWQQYQTAKNKFRLDLFDRRFPMFVATMRLVELAVTKGEIPFEEVQKFAFATKGMEFLFNRELQDYCDNQLRKEALAVFAGKQKIDALTEGEERDTSTGLLMDRLLWFNDQRSEVQKRFAPFLKIRG
jgi:hypothetical protein